MEDIILALLDKGDPGHGRTGLHVAVQLGNRQRVVKMVEQQGQHIFVGDRGLQTPGALVKDLDGLEESNEDDEYLNKLKQLREYVHQKLVKGSIADSTSPEALEKWLCTHPLFPENSEENRQAKADMEVALEKLRLEKELSVGDGIESVAIGGGCASLATCKMHMVPTSATISGASNHVSTYLAPAQTAVPSLLTSCTAIHKFHMLAMSLHLPSTNSYLTREKYKSGNPLWAWLACVHSRNDVPGSGEECLAMGRTAANEGGKPGDG
ncbi:uncharacterized protein BKA55DRAFT_681733 [Fusarium redolens]|uniref:Ankyrin repeat protein n=1 Tax=Fusarium redolens TaxID=48865 RepID=A0A9P9JKE4_FUSRE|nr:uncharacterized protein BKA55DRAFT_681733 [Fusarium redolens]KAH7207811.1 hypothetical protein BKA55DRAFT_681733 [Fusarium redolens]